VSGSTDEREKGRAMLKVDQIETCESCGEYFQPVLLAFEGRWRHGGTRERDAFHAANVQRTENCPDCFEKIPMACRAEWI